MQLLEDLFLAYYEARRNKRNTVNQLKFELAQEDNLLRLYNQLKGRTYHPDRSVAFIITSPVKREVFAANFADRVIHHLYFNYVNEIFERTFICDSYSCRKGKGTLYGIRRLEHHIRSCSMNYSREAYVLKLDISGYFMNINRQLLYDRVIATLKKYAGRKNRKGVLFADALDFDLLFYLTKEIIFTDPVQHCIMKGEKKDWDGLPADKSLFTSREGCGLPIGNLTSQLFSNIYLNDFDHYMKDELKLEHYGRYVDDFYVIHPSKVFLTEIIRKVRSFLSERLGLKLHPKKIYLQNVHRGVRFLGAVVRPHRTYVLQRTVSNFNRALLHGPVLYGKDVVMLRQVVNSYLGFMVHHKSYALRKAMMRKHRGIFRYGWMDVHYKRFRVDSSIKCIFEKKIFFM